MTVTMRFKPPTSDTPEGSDPSCAILVLATGGAVALLFLIAMARVGVADNIIDTLMAGLSVPWFSFQYFTCRKWHRTKIEIV